MNTKFVGKGWAFQYGINISLKKSELEALEPNQYGDIKLCVMQRKDPDEKTKATHFVKVDDYVKEEKPKQSEMVTTPEGEDLPF
jgi:hypothetical protein